MASSGIESASGYSHSHNDFIPEPLTLDARRRVALAEIDDAQFTWFHLKVIMVAGIGMFTDAYNIFTITFASTMIGFVYGDNYNGPSQWPQGLQTLNPKYDLGLKTATLGGVICGQLFFGRLADIMGRRKMYGIELVIMTVSTFVQALAGDSMTGAISIINALIVWRVLMGIGIGGNFPLNAIIVSEFSPIRIRGRLMTIVVLFQGIGIFAAALVAFVVVAAYKNDITDHSLRAVDQMWRLLIGLGCIPAVIGLYFRLTAPETPRFTIDVGSNLEQALADIGPSFGHGEIGHDDEVFRRLAVPKAGWKDFIRYFSAWENSRVLLGASYSWFAIDAIFYGLGLNISALVGDNPFNLNASCNGVGICEKLYYDSATNLIIAILASIPGYFVSFALVDSWGRKRIQFMGFTALGIILIVLGAALNNLKNAGPAGHDAIVFVYCLASFFQTFGPIVSTFIIPGELFPTRYRSTCYGIAAASGKLGATISLVIFHYVQELNIVLIVFGGFMLTGTGSTLWLPEPKGKSLENLSNEGQRGFVQGDASKT
ncbi:hypothetical protein M378DRAFT_164201 [Amanita muscaria Koide BX008]|uniref:Major facilitator superfamily (MFS) profile domain-containing protein n=1 Tax=Amanita muscaria (strain Koide BX008) TaxID=946122 RepID=A0A0C2X4U8_AMAMK|nr:hypothetical protein M378DRAFT_164201 [Amanita muscaria Koide BX008]